MATPRALAMRTMQSGGLGETSGLRARLVLSLIATAGIVAASTSCSLIVDTNADACTADAECTVTGQVCSKVADKPSICAPATCSASAPCKAGSSCVNGACVAGMETGCTTTAMCAAQGENVACRNKKCVHLLSKECTTLYGDYKNDNAVFFGAILPTTGADSSTGKAIENGIQLALDDFNQVAKGLPAAPGSTARRPMVLVGCSDNGDNMTAVTVAKHLVGDVGVVAIIGGAFSGVTIDIATTVTIPANVLLISPSATSVAISDLDDHDLVWRTSPPDSFQAQALTLYMPEIEARVRAELSLMTSDKINVAILHKGDAYGKGLATALEQKLMINGLAALDPSNSGNYKRIDYGNPDDPAANPTDYPGTVSAMLGFKPHITLVFGANEGITDVFSKIEEQWSAAVPYHSQFIFSDAGEIPELWEFVGKRDPMDPTLRTRIRGTVPGTANNLFNAFRSAYASKYQDGTSAEVFGVAGGYDIVYLLGYSAAGLGANPITGASLAQRMKKMSSGAKVDVGSANINSTFLKVTNDGSIDFNGASGPLDFDPKTGEAPSDIQIWCIPKAGGKVGSALNSGYSYSAEQNMLIGKFGPVCN